jgi:hypothetical protein
MSARADVVGGLAVTSLRGEGKLWYIEHASTRLSVVRGGYLRQKRFALQARADLLATGVDFTADPATIVIARDQWRHVAALWAMRASQDRIDWRTGEHYSYSTHYGQVIPSAEHAKRLAEALESYVWS